MASIVHRLGGKGLLPSPPSFLIDNVHYETMVGSIAYGVSNDVSDQDIYGWAIPPMEYLFPAQYGHVALFNPKSVPVYKNYQQHRIKEADSGRVYDLDIYNFAYYMQLCMEGNPNMVDSLFTPIRCVLHMSKAAELVRDRRHLFLHKGYAKKLKGYSHSQLSKMDVKKQNVPAVHELWEFEDQYGIPHSTDLAAIHIEQAARENASPGIHGHAGLRGLSTSDLYRYERTYSAMVTKQKRLDGLKRFGFDVKFAYHVVRLAMQAEQILTEGTLNLEEKSRREIMKAIRRGEQTQDQIKDWYTNQELILNKLIVDSKLIPEWPDTVAIKTLLFEVLETHYGDLSKVTQKPDRADIFMKQIGAMIDQYRGQS